MPCEDAPCCGCCGPNGDGDEYTLDDHLDDLAEFGEGPDDMDDDGMTDAEADADTLASAGMGTDEDYGCYDEMDPDCYGSDDW